MEPASRSVKPLQGALLLALSALLFAFTGVGIRETILFPLLKPSS